MKNASPRLLIAAILLLALLPSLAQAQGTIPPTVSYQGRVKVDGIPFDGLGYFKFAVVQSDGFVPWTNDGTDGPDAVPATPVELSVVDGLFSVLLGDQSVPGMIYALPTQAFTDPLSKLRVWFSPDGGTFTQLPDRPISAVPYAFHAENATLLSGLSYSEFAWADHNHWGQSWSGSGTGLTLNSSGGPGFVVGSGDNDGVYVSSAGGDGMDVHAAGQDGFYVGSAGDDGLQIGFQTWAGAYVGAGDDGIAIYDAGNAPTHALPPQVGYGDTNDGIDIAGAKDFGVWVGYAGNDGLYVNSTLSDGLMIWSAQETGVTVRSARMNGVTVAESGNHGVQANTIRTDSMWGFYTPDKVGAMNVTMQSLSIIARNDGPSPLQAGDVVAVTGVDRPQVGGSTPMPNVRRADRLFSGTIGVVETRLELTVVDPTKEWDERGGTPSNVKPEDVIHEEAHSLPGDAAPGEYISIVVFGIANVKVEASTQAIVVGQRLTAAHTAGHARALQARMLEGMTVTEGAPVLGIALEPLQQGTGTIPVFVMLR